MALPTTIGGISLLADNPGAAPVGPFKSSAGNYYVIGESGAASTHIRAIKASDPTTSFSAVGTDITALTNSLAFLSAFQVGDVIHVAANDSGSTTTIDYVTFNMATDTWGTVETVATSNTTGSVQLGIVVRSDGSVVVAFPGNTNAVMGSHFNTVYFNVRTSGTWGTPVEIDSGGSTNWQAVVAVLGASDTTHFMWAGGSTTARQRALNSSNVLQTQTTVSAGQVANPVSAVSYVSGAATKVIVIYNPTIVMFFDSGNTPTLTFTGSVTPGGPGRMYNDGTNAWILGTTGGTPATLQVAESTNNGSTWGAATNLSDVLNNAAVAAYMSLNGNVYQRGTNVVLPFAIYNSSNNLIYNEYVIRSTAVPYVPFKKHVTPLEHDLYRRARAYA